MFFTAKEATEKIGKRVECIKGLYFFDLEKGERGIVIGIIQLSQHPEEYGVVVKSTFRNSESREDCFSKDQYEKFLKEIEWVL